MFDKVLDFSYPRTARQAFGWYFVFFLFEVILAGIGGALFGGFRGGLMVAVLAQLVLGAALVRYKQKSVFVVLLVLGASFISIFTGALGELIPLAFVTTFGRYKTVEIQT